MAKIPEPMNIAEAIETMKIVRPYLDGIIGQDTSFGLIKSLIDQIKERNPMDSLRLICLLHRTRMDQVVEHFQGAGGSDLIEALSAGFQANPLPDLVNSARVLGLTELEWKNAS